MKLSLNFKRLYMLLTFHRSDSSFELETDTMMLTLKENDEVSWCKPLTECTANYRPIESIDHFFEIIFSQRDIPKEWKQEAERYIEKQLLE